MVQTVRLEGNLIDITGNRVDASTSVTVKKPTPELGPGHSVTTTQPERVDIGPDGEFFVEVVQGVGWLYINGNGWSDSIKFVAAEGMTKLWEAVLNALPVPAPIGEYLSVKDGMQRLIAEAVAKTKSWDQGRTTDHPAGSPPDGVMRVASDADGEHISLPSTGQGFVTTVTWGNPGYEVRLQVAETVNAGVLKTYRRYFYKGAWQEWTDEVSKSASSNTAPTNGVAGARDGSPVAGLKTVPVALSLGNMPGNTRPATGSYRNKFLFNAPIFRWRVCMSARNPRFGTTNGADVKVSRITFGEHAGGGKFAAAPRTIATNLVLGRDGSVAKSDWQTGGIVQNKEFLLGYDYTGKAETFGLVGSCWKTTTGTAADAAPALSTDWLTPLDIWLEVETYAGTPVVAAFGDSLTCGVGNTWSVFDSWLSKYCRDNEALPVHYAASGDNAGSWASDFRQYKWTRWDEHATPDAVIYALGSNDIASSTLDEIKQHTLAVVGEIQRKWNTAVYAVNFTPRNTWINQPGDEVRKQYNQWLATQPWPRQVFDFSTVVRDTATGGIKESYNGDNVHLNTAGYAAEAASITPPVTAPPVLYKN